MPNLIVLIGLAGCGKSGVGPAIATALGLPVAMNAAKRAGGGQIQPPTYGWLPALRNGVRVRLSL